MKISTFALVAVALYGSPVAGQEDGLSCLDDGQMGEDAFPDKVSSPQHSKGWDVKYCGSYKLAKNIFANVTYVLYQQGTEPPPVSSSSAQIAIAVPISRISIDTTPMIPFIEHLGMESSIVAFTSTQGASIVSSPCLLESIEDKEVVLVTNPTDVENFKSLAANGTISTSASVDGIDGTIAFVNPWNSDPPFSQSVILSESSEKTSSAVFEWIKFVSLFFNLEAKADCVFAQTQDRWECVTNAAGTVVDDSPKKKVLWAYYSDYCEGWDVGECPNYYCEYSRHCSAELLNSTEGVFSEKCFATYMTTEQLVEFGKDADHWIFPGPNWDETYTLFKDQLDTMKSVQEKEVYDYQGSGSNAWFEQRFAEYYFVLQDFCSIVGTSPPLPKSWFRNTLKNDPIGGLGVCTESSRANAIFPIDDNLCPDPSSTLSCNEISMAGTAWTSVSAVFVALLVFLY